MKCSWGPGYGHPPLVVMCLPTRRDGWNDRMCWGATGILLLAPGPWLTCLPPVCIEKALKDETPIRLFWISVLETRSSMSLITRVSLPCDSFIL